MIRLIDDVAPVIIILMMWYLAIVLFLALVFGFWGFFNPGPLARIEYIFPVRPFALWLFGIPQ